MHKFLILVFLIVPRFGRCQLHNDPFLTIAVDSSAPSHIIEAGSTYNLGSNALTGKFYNAVFNSGFVVDDAKNSPLPYLKAKNNDFGGYLDNYVFYSWKPNEKETWFFINVDSRIQYSSIFSADAYKLVLFGNDLFAGKTADASGFQFSHYAYQSLQFGFYKYNRMANDNVLLYGGGISIVSGSGYYHLSISRGTLYTSPQGDSLSLDAKASSKAVSPTSQITDVNGLGASINGFLALSFSGNNELRLQVADLGAVDWFNKISQFSINSQVSYTGENVSVINGKASITQYYQALDTIAKQAGKPDKGSSFIALLPYQIRMVYTHRFNDSWAAMCGMEYINDNMQIPELDFSATKNFIRHRLYARLGFSVFGYSQYGIEAGAGYQIGKKWNINIGTQHLEGLSFIAYTHGQGYYAAINWTI